MRRPKEKRTAAMTRFLDLMENHLKKFSIKKQKEILSVASEDDEREALPPSHAKHLARPERRGLFV
jgi:hypothetical protein